MTCPSFTDYCKSYGFGHRILTKFFDEPVSVEEKVDGSQFSFCKSEDGQLLVRSRRREFDIYAPDNLFQEACQTVINLKDELKPGWTYRGEYLKKPKQNCLSYSRIPAQHVMLFDVAIGDSDYLSYQDLVVEAERLGLEPIPQLEESIKLTSPDQVKELLSRESVLGGEKIEGMVFKRRQNPLFNQWGKMVMAKLVADGFRERNDANFQKHKEASGKKDLIQELVLEFRSPVRWQKAVQHLAESGELEQEPRDIGKLIKEVQKDILEDHQDEIKERLFELVKKQFTRGITRGLPEWYREKLIEQQFRKKED